MRRYRSGEDNPVLFGQCSITGVMPRKCFDFILLLYFNSHKVRVKTQCNIMRNVLLHEYKQQGIIKMCCRMSAKSHRYVGLFCLVNILHFWFSQDTACWLFMCKPEVEEENPTCSTEDALTCLQISGALARMKHVHNWVMWVPLKYLNSRGFTCKLYFESSHISLNYYLSSHCILFKTLSSWYIEL